MVQKKTIVIIGAGFGGLRAATLLGRKIKKRGLKNQYKIVLIDSNTYHTYTPLLYEAATTDKETANYVQIKNLVTYPVAELIKKLPIRFIQNEIVGLDLIKGLVYCKSFEITHEELKFDYLILAPGSETNYFNIPGLKENSLTLKSFLDALKIRNAMLEATAVKKNTRIVIGGGGSTGVELAGELKEWLPELSIAIIEAAPNILMGFEPKVVSRVQKRLNKLKIELLVNKTITEAKKNLLSLKDGSTINFDILIWCGGVKASGLIRKLPLKTETKGRIEVEEAMSCLPHTENLKLYGQVYGIGDAVCCYDPVTKKPMPMVARAAISQATVAVNNILGKNLKFYCPKTYPYVIPVGGKYAVAKIGPFIFSGIIGWLLKGLVELNYLLSIMPIGYALKTWLRGLYVFIKNDRLG